MRKRLRLNAPMNKESFCVTFELVTPESAENGEASETGFLSEGCSLREAVDLLGGSAHEADSFPLTRSNPPRWFTYTDSDPRDFRTGEIESRSLHLPRNTTPSSALRVARLLGVRLSY